MAEHIPRAKGWNEIEVYKLFDGLCLSYDIRYSK